MLRSLGTWHGSGRPQARKRGGPKLTLHLFINEHSNVRPLKWG